MILVLGSKKKRNPQQRFPSLGIHLSSKDQSVPDLAKTQLQKSLDQLESREVRGDFTLYSSLLAQCSAARCLAAARRIHALILRDRYNSELVINNLVVRMFGACGGLDEARSLFARIRPRNVFSYNIMLGALAQNRHLYDARNLFDLMPGRTDVSWTAMISSYASTGEVSLAKEIFDEIPEKDRISWNAMITAYAQAGYCYEALEMLRNMDLEGLQPDNITFISSINCCSTVGCQVTGRQLHDDVVDLGLMAHVSVATACVSMYGKFGRLEKATEIFDKMPQRNGGQLYNARVMFDCMPMQNASTWNTLIAAFGQRGDLEEATDLFHRMPLPNLISWNTIIFANAQNGRGENSIKLLMRMDVEGLRPNRVTLLAVIDACSNIGNTDLGRMVLSIVEEMEFTHQVAIATALVAMFARCQNLDSAKLVFDNADQHDVMLCNSMLYAYTQNGHLEAAKRMFSQMKEKNTVSFNLMITMNVQNGLIDDAEKMLSTMPDRDVVSNNTMMLGYAQVLKLEQAKCIFDKMQEKNIVSWNTMILAFAQNGHYSDAWLLYRTLNLDGFHANNFTFVGALEALLGISSLRETRALHAMILESGFLSDVSVATGLVNVYGKCGNISEATRIFHGMPTKSMVSWSAMITAYAQNGHNMSALTCFGLMQQQGFIPDAVTFVAAISACSHAGLVEAARGYFLSMQVDFMIDPICEHFGCLIDLLGRSGRLEAAQELIKCMPFLPDSSSWTALLNACCIHGDLTRASSIGDLIIEMPGCDEAGPYVLLSNVYSVLGERGKAARVQEILSRKISKGLTIVDIPRIS
ncbi:pentatricopeptide repeat-containing protein At4g02750-like [Selaginella moellendorffii]|uniref:pentatricopeptide repeat-containing protein At4g02750-like n=1 Tax=Selaginella moellendorffii TaxID=88036 RepID=UPI000D1CC5B8|nr:pentatricopeptide repeat-containing protein At4g02750-like [Selaginella moellendorffii]|eukprot:XP_024540214.1 pentatricopeptide repeat-containing protein At4g02750-like [Selaginella moellendorffii]